MISPLPSILFIHQSLFILSLNRPPHRSVCLHRCLIEVCSTSSKYKNRQAIHPFFFLRDTIQQVDRMRQSCHFTWPTGDSLISWIVSVSIETGCCCQNLEWARKSFLRNAFSAGPDGRPGVELRRRTWMTSVAPTLIPPSV